VVELPAEAVAVDQHMKDLDTDATPLCGCLGCTNDATKRVKHPDHGQRTVCDDHVQDFEVVADV